MPCDDSLDGFWRVGTTFYSLLTVAVFSVHFWMQKVDHGS